MPEPVVVPLHRPWIRRRLPISPPTTAWATSRGSALILPPAPAFVDPGPAVLDLERRLLAIDCTHREVAYLDYLSKVIVEHSQGNKSGLSRFDVDAVFASLLRARQNLAEEIGQFRDGLDDLKFLLGLSPTAPVVLDRQVVAAFSALFTSVESWSTHANRNLGDLSRLIDQSPAPGEILLNGLRVLERLDKDPELLEYFLKVAAQRVQKSRSERDQIVVQPNSGVQLELRVRRQIRGLLDKKLAFESEKRRYEMAVRLRDQSFERLFAPPTPVVNSRSLLVAALLDQLAQVLDTQDRLAGLWTSFRSERLSLYRNLGDLPYGDWKTFYADLSAVSVPAPAQPAIEPRPGKGAAAPLKPPIFRAQ